MNGAHPYKSELLNIFIFSLVLSKHRKVGPTSRSHLSNQTMTLSTDLLAIRLIS